MNQRIIGVILVVAVVLGLIGLAVVGSDNSNDSDGTQTATPPPASQETAEEATEPAATEPAVTISDFKFQPETITVKKGTTVTWTNQDTVAHNVASDADSPKGGLAGPLLNQGETYSFTFNDVGTYRYHCDPHPFMKGTVEVTE
jgi:amicyanin